MTETPTMDAVADPQAADLFGGALPRQAAGWSINRLAQDLRLDRRTITNRLVNVAPLSDGPSGPIYALADAARAIFGQTTLKEADELRRRLLAAQAESAELELQRKRGELVDANAVRTAAMENARIEREALCTWPTRAAPTLAAELGVEQVVLTAALEREIRRYMEERANDDGLPALP